MTYLIFFLLPFIIHCDSELTQVCKYYSVDNNTNNSNCIINQTLMFNDSINISVTTLLIQNTQINCSINALYSKCAFRVNASKIEVINSTMYFAIIEFSSFQVSITSSNLSTNGSIKYGFGRPSNTDTCVTASNDVGNGYAGSGAYCQDLNPKCGIAYGALNLLLNQTTNDSDKTLGTGSGQFINDFYGCGGGRVFINTTNLMINGTVMFSASGSPQQEPGYYCPNRTDKTWDILNGGTGGYIFLGVTNVIQWTNLSVDMLKLIAEGGNYCDAIDGKSTKFAGSGGRILVDVNVDQLVNVQFSLKGGVNDPSVKATNVNPCRNGAAGSLFFFRNNTVVLNNDGFAANTITQIPGNQNYSRIMVSNGARGGPYDDDSSGLMNADNIIVSMAYLAYGRFSSQLNITCDSLVINGTQDNFGGIGPPEQNSKTTSLRINAQTVNFSNVTTIQFGKEFNLISNVSSLKGSIQSYFFDSGLYISSNQIIMQEAEIEVSAIAVSTSNDLLIKNSRLKAFKQKCKDQNITYFPYVNLLDYDLNLSNFAPGVSVLDTLHGLIAQNFTFFIITPKQLNFTADNTTSDVSPAYVQGANLGVFAYDIAISSDFTLSSEDLGCNNEQGLGKGTQDPNLGNKCGGTGGSYGGFGSLAWSNYSDILKDCLKIKSPSIYGDMINPIYEGSGGGGNQERLNPGGKGGGVIIIAAAQSLSIDGNVTSSGSSPETQMGKATAGSGSGGSIQLFMETLAGNGIVKSEGGSTQSSGIGGPGGGGRIRVNFRSWFEKGDYSQGWKGSFSVSQGKKSDFINWPDDGSEIMAISTTPCMPGHSGEVCGPCGSGTYKNIVGAGACFECLNKPDNAYYSNTGETHPQCGFSCDSRVTGNEKEVNPNCYTPFYFYIDKMGGYPGIIAIALVLIIILIIVVIRFSKKKKKVFRDSLDKNHNILDDGNKEKGTLKKELANAAFCMEDMPYHLKRIYLVGENNSRNPWCINKNECLDITHHEIDIIKYNDFLKAVNQKLKYNTLLNCLLVIIRWLYYPLYYLLIYLFRHRKNKMMLDYIPDFKILYRNQEAFNPDEPLIPLILKFSTTPDLTLGYIDILNYNKSVLEWSSMKFPICLIMAGEGSFLFPLYLNQHDPLVKTLGTIINEEGQNEEREIWDVEKLETNELDAGGHDKEKAHKKRKINFQDFLKGFNETARRIDYWCSLGDFMKSVMELLEYVEKHNNEYFKQKNMRAEVFLHQIADLQETKDPSKQTTITFLDKGSKADLEKCLKEAQKFKHYNHCYDIKFSLNLIRNEEISQRNSSLNRNEMNFDFLMKRPQMIEDKKTENADEDMEFLKKKLLSKLEKNSPEIQNLPQDQNVAKWDFLKEEWPQNLRAWFDKVERFWGYFRAFFLRFRSSKENSSLLPVALFFFLIVDLMVLLIIIVIAIGDWNSNKAGIAYVYPFSVVISTGLFVIWFGCLQNNILLGKLFLIYNAQSMINMIVGFIVALSLQNSGKSKWDLEIVVNLLFTIEKFIILYVGSKYLSLK